MRHDSTTARRIRVAVEIAAIVTSARALVTELRNGRRLHAGHAALKLAVAVVGAVLANRAIDEIAELGEGS